MCTALAAALLFSVAAGVSAQAFFSPQTSQRAATKYPILLVHGAGFHDTMAGLNYWGRIPAALEQNGAQVFFGGQDAWGSVEVNAATIKESVERILDETGADRVNIIAHSRGGIEARYMISSLGMAPYVASLTTVSTPHHGSRTVDVFTGMPTPFRRMVAGPVNAWFWLIGDRRPDFYSSIESMSTDFMTQFNIDHPDDPRVYVQSFAGRMDTVWSDPLIAPAFAVVYWFDGPNDGLVSVESAQWGNFRGVIRSASHRGVSHADTTDYRRMNFSLWASDDGIADIREFYIELAADLKSMGL